MRSAMQFGVWATVCEDKTALKKKNNLQMQVPVQPSLFSFEYQTVFSHEPCSTTDEAGAIEIGFQGAVCIYIAIFFAC